MSSDLTKSVSKRFQRRSHFISLSYSNAPWLCQWRLLHYIYGWVCLHLSSFHHFSFSSNLLSLLYWSVLAEFSVSWCMFSYQNVIWRVQRTAVYLGHQLHCTVIAYNPQRVAGDVYAPLLSWISGLSFDSPFLSLVFFCLVLLLFLSCHFSANE